MSDKNKTQKQVSVAQRIRSGTVALAVIPLVIAAVGLGAFAYLSERAAIEDRVEAQLVSLRSVKAQQIQGYFDNVSKLIQQHAVLPQFVEATKSLNAQFPQLKERAAKTMPQQRADLKAYYAGPFSQEYSKRTGAAPQGAAAIADTLAEETVAAQYQYIATNPKPLGQKGETDARDDGSDYSKTHASFHPTARKLVERFGLYDLFLVDPATGFVVYTYFKELDYGSNLLTGPYAKTPLAEAFLAGKQAAKPDTVWLTDLAPYFPSYEDQATFISVPIFEGSKLVSVMVVQVPIDQINDVMTFSKKWSEAGLDKTGETYLVGADSAPRSISRGMLEDKDGFVRSLKGLLTEPVLAAIASTKSDIGLRKLDSPGIKRSLAGESSVANYDNYRQKSVLGAFGPVQVLNQKFGLIAEMESAEALAPAQASFVRLMIGAALLIALLIGAALWVAKKLAATVIDPLGKLQATVTKLQAGDFNARAELTSKDEFGQLGNALDNLLNERLTALQAAANENEKLNNSVVEIMQAVGTIATTKDLTSRVPVAEDLTGAIADAMNLLNEETGRVLGSVASVSRAVAQSSEAVRDQSDLATAASRREQTEVDAAARELGEAAHSLGMIAQSAIACNDSAERAVQATTDALEIVNQTVQGVVASRELIRETEKRIKRLGERSQEISLVVTIIQTIAERTGILALNASMHAASAGEAGRSFSLVADEVKRLSESARDSTSQISRLITAIQNETKDTVITMNQAITQVVEINRLADSASAGMVRTQFETNALASSVRAISETSKVQARAGESLIARAKNIQEASAETAKQLFAQAAETKRLAQYSRTLIDEVSVFKLPQ